MKIANFSRRNAVNETDLQQAGFTVEEIVVLARLRHSYPLLGELVTRRERRWLEFIKWCYATGRIDE
jgi:hypothetical protein